AARRVDEREGAVVADRFCHLERLIEILVRLAGEADDDVSGQRAVGHVLANERDTVEVALASIGPPHALEDRARARLERQMNGLAQRRQLCVSAYHVLAHVLGMRAGVADPPYALDGVDLCQQLRKREPGLGRQVAAIGVDVLAEKGHLDYAIVGELLDLAAQLLGITAHLSAARRRNDAVRADAVASDTDLHPALVLAF